MRAVHQQGATNPLSLTRDIPAAALRYVDRLQLKPNTRWTENTGVREGAQTCGRGERVQRKGGRWEC